LIDAHNDLDEYAGVVKRHTEDLKTKITILEARTTYSEGQINTLGPGGNAPHSSATYPRDVHNDPTTMYKDLRIPHNNDKEKLRTHLNEWLDTTKAKASSVFPVMQLVCYSPSSTFFECKNVLTPYVQLTYFVKQMSLGHVPAAEAGPLLDLGIEQLRKLRDIVKKEEQAGLEDTKMEDVQGDELKP
jgi:hypothetical protein